MAWLRRGWRGRGRPRGWVGEAPTKLTPAVLLLNLAACAAPSVAPPLPAQPYACLLPAEQRMLVAELFFGRDIRGRGPLSDAEWADFAAQIVTPNFPDGFTVTDGNGQWQNPATREITRQPTKI